MNLGLPHQLPCFYISCSDDKLCVIFFASAARMSTCRSIYRASIYAGMNAQITKCISLDRCGPSRLPSGPKPENAIRFLSLYLCRPAVAFSSTVQYCTWAQAACICIKYSAKKQTVSARLLKKKKYKKSRFPNS